MLKANARKIRRENRAQAIKAQAANPVKHTNLVRSEITPNKVYDLILLGYNFFHLSNEDGSTLTYDIIQVNKAWRCAVYNVFVEKTGKSSEEIQQEFDNLADNNTFDEVSKIVKSYEKILDTNIELFSELFLKALNTDLSDMRKQTYIGA